MFWLVVFGTLNIASYVDEIDAVHYILKKTGSTLSCNQVPITLVFEPVFMCFSLKNLLGTSRFKEVHVLKNIIENILFLSMQRYHNYFNWTRFLLEKYYLFTIFIIKYLLLVTSARLELARTLRFKGFSYYFMLL